MTFAPGPDFYDVMSPLERKSTLSLGVAAILTLVVQTGVDIANGDGFAHSLTAQMLYFTNLCVLVIGVGYVVIGIKGRWPGVSFPAAMTIWILIVGIVYHALLASTHHPTGLDVYVNLMQHTLLPLASLAIWICFAPKTGLTVMHAVIWVSFPLAYAVYGVARGMVEGKFPYFFLDPVKTGWGVVGIYVVGLGILFFLSGLLLVLATRKWSKAALPN